MTTFRQQTRLPGAEFLPLPVGTRAATRQEPWSAGQPGDKRLLGCAAPRARPPRPQAPLSVAILSVSPVAGFLQTRLIFILPHLQA